MKDNLEEGERGREDAREDKEVQVRNPNTARQRYWGGEESEERQGKGLPQHGRLNPDE